MAIFGNDAINRVNIHYGIQALAAGAGGVFFFTFLLHAGIPVPTTLAKRWGLRRMVIVGAPTPP
jgi:hypothetical protein